jgi:hypothetical protein
MGSATRIAALGAVLTLGGCATSYQLSLMPRDRGVIYTGTAEDNGSGEGPIAVTIEGKTFSGTWVQATPDRTNAYVTGGIGWGWRRGGSLGTIITMDNPQGGEAKALLSAPDGSGLRCDLRNGAGRGDGICRDDQGRTYDVQIRPGPRR